MAEVRALAAHALPLNQAHPDGWSADEIARKKAFGIYYTPESAARILAQWAIRSADDHVLEPSFGGCAMLSAAVARLNELGVRNPGAQLYGYDIDPVAFDHLARLGISRNNFVHGSYLVDRGEQKTFDAVIANPPFVSWAKCSPERQAEVQLLRDRLNCKFHNRASLWVYFLLLSVRSVSQGGRLAFVLPNSILTADYARPVLQELVGKFERVQVINVTAKLFIEEGTAERTSILLADGYEGSDLTGKIDVRDVADLESLERLIASQRESTPDARQERLRRQLDAARRTPWYRTQFIRLGDAFDVNIGEVVGDTRYFVRTRAEWTRLGIPASDLAPIIARSASVPGMLLDKTMVGDEQMSCLLLPQSDQFSDSVEMVLSSYDEASRLSNRTFAKRRVWYRCSYDTKAAAFLAAISTVGPRVIQNQASVSCSNSLYKVTVINRDCEWAPWLAAIALTTPFQLSAEQFGRIRGSGGLKLEPRDAKQLALPARVPDMADVDRSTLLMKLHYLAVSGSWHEATQLADKRLLLDQGIISGNRLHTLRERLAVLRGIRRGR